MGKRVRNVERVRSTGRRQVVNDRVTTDRNNMVYIDFCKYPKWTKSFRGKKFVNSFKDESEAGRNFYFLINQVFSNLEDNIKEILSRKQSHCHVIHDNNKLNIIKKIIKGIHNFDLGHDADIWQIGGKKNQGIRLFGVLSKVNSTIYEFYPLFIDPHHLVYPSKKYNDKDYKNYSFMPHKEWG